MRSGSSARNAARAAEPIVDPVGLCGELTATATVCALTAAAIPVRSVRPHRSSATPVNRRPAAAARMG